jgi:hypothetical protein
VRYCFERCGSVSSTATRESAPISSVVMESPPVAICDAVAAPATCPPCSARLRPCSQSSPRSRRCGVPRPARFFRFQSELNPEHRARSASTAPWSYRLAAAAAAVRLPAARAYLLRCAVDALPAHFMVAVHTCVIRCAALLTCVLTVHDNGIARYPGDILLRCGYPTVHTV